MNLKFVGVLTIGACLLVIEVFSECSLTKEVIEEETRIFATEVNGYYRLLSSDSVPANERLHMICNESDVKIVRCAKNGRFSKSLPIGNCEKPIKVVVDQTYDPDCSKQTYRVGYKLRDQFLELYRSCYDKELASAIFTKHILKPFPGVSDRPTAYFSTDQIVSNLVASSFERRQIYARFRQIFGIHQSYVTSDKENLINRGHLAPSADFLFVDGKRATFKYINVAPQFRTVNVGNWKAIENWIRTRVDENHQEAFVVTGTLGILNLIDFNNNFTPIYLAPGDLNPIPKWIYKVVHMGSDRFVFLTYNNIYWNTAENPNCTVEFCPRDIRLVNSQTAGFTFCCNYREFVRSHLPSLMFY